MTKNMKHSYETPEDDVGNGLHCVVWCVYKMYI